MGKRSNFARRPMDEYDTIDPRAVQALRPYIRYMLWFAEPCCGSGRLVGMLEDAGLACRYRQDIQHGVDALDMTDYGAIDAIITNPPWTREILHKLIVHFQAIAPTWLLFDADWAHTKQAAPFLPQCSHIVSVGRLRWIEGTKQTGKDNCAWYCFDKHHKTGPIFIGQPMKEAA